MTDPLSIAIAAAAAATAFAAGLAQWPRPPQLDGERWFKVALATVLRGEIEAAGGDAATWEQRVLRFVPYHPAGRWPERKVANPVAARLPGASLPGERALLDALARIDSVPGRWARMYDHDEVATAARLDDPVELGPAYDPSARVGPGGSWEELAAWGGGDGAFGAALRRRVPAKWALVEGRPDRAAGPTLLPAFAEVLGDVVVVPWAEGSLESQVRAVTEALRAAAPTVDARVVVVGEEAGVALVLRALADAADIRDRVQAFVSVGGVVGGRPGEAGPFGERDAADWLDARFTQRGLDTEVVRLTPYLSVQWLDRASPVLGAAGLPLSAQRFPDPGESEAVDTVEVVDLGVLPSDPELPTRAVAKALVAVVCCWVLSRR